MNPRALALALALAAALTEVLARASDTLDSEAPPADPDGSRPPPSPAPGDPPVTRSDLEELRTELRRVVADRSDAVRDQVGELLTEHTAPTAAALEELRATLHELQGGDDPDDDDPDDDPDGAGNEADAEEHTDEGGTDG